MSTAALYALASLAGCTRGDPAPIGGIANFSRVSETLYRGAQPTPEGYAELKKRGVRTIISLRVFAFDRKRLAGHGFRFHHLSVKHVHPEMEDVLDFLAVVSAPENQPVFVHCRMGEDRAGMMVAAYRMVVQGWTRERALADMKQMGFNEINEPIEDFVERLDVADVKRQLASLRPPRVEVIP